ncbi:MAG: hypothetical protein AAFX06_25725 [Planctomycetota bacterium]
MITREELPESELCCECGADTDQVLWFRIQCETAWSSESTNRNDVLMVLSVWLAALVSVLSPRRGYQSPEIHGREVAVSVPIRWCHNCVQPSEQKVSMRAARKQLKTIAIYAELLKEYPQATLEPLEGEPTGRAVV